uniref:L5 protein n=1 Tax=Agaricus bisporus virus 1 TaxID=46339 RepID=Q90194_9VIRU|nr:L5 protein - white button mushroom virus 1 [White button mushroom virus 1]CAA64145.1 L5 [Agaricus bisporus virus 1]
MTTQQASVMRFTTAYSSNNKNANDVVPGSLLHQRLVKSRELEEHVTRNYGLPDVMYSYAGTLPGEYARIGSQIEKQIIGKNLSNILLELCDGDNMERVKMVTLCHDVMHNKVQKIAASRTSCKFEVSEQSDMEVKIEVAFGSPEDGCQTKELVITFEKVNDQWAFVGMEALNDFRKVRNMYRARAAKKQLQELADDHYIHYIRVVNTILLTVMSCKSAILPPVLNFNANGPTGHETYDNHYWGEPQRNMKFTSLPTEAIETGMLPYTYLEEKSDRQLQPQEGCRMLFVTAEENIYVQGVSNDMPAADVMCCLNNNNAHDMTIYAMRNKMTNEYTIFYVQTPGYVSDGLRNKIKTQENVYRCTAFDDQNDNELMEHLQPTHFAAFMYTPIGADGKTIETLDGTMVELEGLEPERTKLIGNDFRKDMAWMSFFVSRVMYTGEKVVHRPRDRIRVKTSIAEHEYGQGLVRHKYKNCFKDGVASKYRAYSQGVAAVLSPLEVEVKPGRLNLPLNATVCQDVLEVFMDMEYMQCKTNGEDRMVIPYAVGAILYKNGEAISEVFASVTKEDLISGMPKVRSYVDPGVTDMHGQLEKLLAKMNTESQSEVSTRDVTKLLEIIREVSENNINVYAKGVTNDNIAVHGEISEPTTSALTVYKLGKNAKLKKRLGEAGLGVGKLSDYTTEVEHRPIHEIKLFASAIGFKSYDEPERMNESMFAEKINDVISGYK